MNRGGPGHQSYNHHQGYNRGGGGGGGGGGYHNQPQVHDDHYNYNNYNRGGGGGRGGNRDGQGYISRDGRDGRDGGGRGPGGRGGSRDGGDGRGGGNSYGGYNSDRVQRPYNAADTRGYSSRPRRDSERSKTSEEFKEPTPGKLFWKMQQRKLFLKYWKRRGSKLLALLRLRTIL